MSPSSFLLSPGATILQTISTIDANHHGGVVVVDAAQHCLAVITDGDIRRAILAGTDLREPVSTLVAARTAKKLPPPITAPVSSTPEARLELMRKFHIRHLPIVDPDNTVLEMCCLEDLLEQSSGGMNAVVMAGGQGRRLRPYTENTPKPMLPVGGKPLLERLIEQLKHAGVSGVRVTTHYKSEKIMDHFGNGAGFGVTIGYVQEDEPLGTAGALRLLKRSAEPLLVVNGDILTRINFRALLDFHLETHADLTVAVREYTSQVPYGVIEVDGIKVMKLEEKPTTRHFINAGIYLLNPAILELIPSDKRPFDMTDFITLLIAQQRSVVSFPVREYWLDIGHVENYHQAQTDLADGKLA